MDIKEFFELSAGKWFCQRTSYNLENQQVQSGKSDLTIEILAGDSSDAIALCQKQGQTQENLWGAVKVSWDNSGDYGKNKQVGSTLLIPIPNPDNDRAGQLLYSSSNVSEPAIAGRYILGEDDALTLIVEGKDTYSEERIWFASPNLRLRASLIKNNSDFSRTAFYSEIRRIPPKE
ncbi:phycobiliprotein lyase [Lusitaniella coriacea LEGE 07157]|uniref:Chromophore lyase CpcS/CpeS n=1 Tax=Lusitaniella coriacea LEGE 07157 TaxID=945747 RepID=A0A8J7DWJ1_9CYAN|nr:phycobiliprotein lyase [Lusitaniella coriacea]MBE9116512.1 phycobiliprotein lyase [Lusitaniella coriacea LEGE 07157]